MLGDGIDGNVQHPEQDRDLAAVYDPGVLAEAVDAAAVMKSARYEQ